MTSTLLGSWALLAPISFANFIAYPPVNEHLLHDLGAFQIGLGVALFASLRWRDGPGVALCGFATAATLHVVNHVVDHPHLGGHCWDAWALAALALIALVGVGIQWSARDRTERDRQ